MSPKEGRCLLLMLLFTHKVISLSSACLIKGGVNWNCYSELLILYQIVAICWNILRYFICKRFLIEYSTILIELVVSKRETLFPNYLLRKWLFEVDGEFRANNSIKRANVDNYSERIDCTLKKERINIDIIRIINR